MRLCQLAALFGCCAQAFIAHQVEEEANVLPRLATVLPGEGHSTSQRGRGSAVLTTGWHILIAAAGQRLFHPEINAAAQEQRSLAVAFYHAKQKVELLRPSGAPETGTAAGGSGMAVDAPTGA